MTGDNYPRDEAMREIEAALEHYAMACIDEIGDGTPECYERTNAAKGKLLALIRSKLPQPDEPGLPEKIAQDAFDRQEKADAAWLSEPLTERESASTKIAEKKLVSWPGDVEQKDAGGWGEDDDRFRANEKHERAVEACDKALMSTPIHGRNLYVVHGDDIDNALRLMRARPAPHTFYGGTEHSYAELIAKEQAAGELMRAAKALLDESDIIQCDNPDVIPRFLDAIAKAERAGIKP